MSTSFQTLRSSNLSYIIFNEYYNVIKVCTYFLRNIKKGNENPIHITVLRNSRANSFCVDCRDTSIRKCTDLDAPATEKGKKPPSQGL